MKLPIYPRFVYIAILVLNFPLLAQGQLAALSSGAKKKAVSVSAEQKIALIFPDNVAEVVIGNNKICFTKSSNKCFLNASDAKGFSPTSLFISLTSGAYYDFILKYRPYVDTTVYLLSEGEADGTDTYLKKAAEIEVSKVVNASPLTIPFKPAEEFINNSNLVLEKPVFFTDKGAIGQHLVFFLQSIYHENNKTYVRISAKNFSNVSYDIRDIKFQLTPSKGFLRSLAGERQEVKPVFVLNGHKNNLEPKATISKVFVFDRLHFNDKKELWIVISEGSTNYRQLQFALSSQDMEKALALNK
jgi:hypothetical protein